MQTEKIGVRTIKFDKVKIKSSEQGFIRNGHSPYIDETTMTWFEYDDKLQEYVDTGISAGTGSVVDDALSEESEHPVQNKVVTKELNSKLAEQSMKVINPIDIASIWENA